MWRHCLLAAFLIVSARPILCTAQDAPPLSPDELRETLQNLLEGLAAQDRAAALEENRKLQLELAERERAIFADRLKLEQDMRHLVERERDIEKRRGDDLDKLLTALQRRPGFGCFLKHLVTLWLARC